MAGSSARFLRSSKRAQNSSSKSFLQWQPSQKSHSGLSFLGLATELRQMILENLPIVRTIFTTSDASNDAASYPETDNSADDSASSTASNARIVMFKDIDSNRDNLQTLGNLMRTCHQLYSEVATIKYETVCATHSRGYPEVSPFLINLGSVVKHIEFCVYAASMETARRDSTG
ncbi:hypothetical protein EJ08DRAFT_695728 [Tothia fuscella]|uniref:Uncharacterized protein n=1 Tax=Tothia fuscella TaxID=1048955 RepID=A0A9P4U0T5_9PEZI|nr:hypothetical protein EJ08DRAFT_695728 [Tothia fuscella]